ncbi:MAG: cysteine dioxygenase [Pseudomonadota bacterium]|nr:cysteine dioxygenase [Pseudomonadota bacterium]MEC8960816.1 cysteine dioxygenase [Pseudomonadota bacterium]|tara:strand:+ start:234 stop:827 length:594 start_codon:yes stop_codon:yes gene_type:complete
MTIIEQRDQAVAETVDRVRLIEQQHGVNYDTLGKIRDELIDLTRNKEMFPRSSFPITEDGGSAVYRISEDSDHRYALYASVGAAGKSVPPHNHTTWAVIVGVYGDELNRFYERTDDASKEGYAELKETGSFVVQHGNGVVFLPDDIHAISTDDSEPTVHLHMYGLALDHLHERLVFDQVGKTVNTMSIRVDIQTPVV